MRRCVMPSRNARHGQLYTRSGVLRIKNARFKADPQPDFIALDWTQHLNHPHLLPQESKRLALMTFNQEIAF